MVASRRASDLAFDGVILLVCLVAVAVALYPFIYVLSVSISDAEEAFRGKVWIVPAGLSVKAYEIVLDNPGMWRSYYNTVWYVVVGTGVNITLTILAAYPLSRRELLGKNLIITMMVLTVYVSGGLIPFYRLVKEIGLFNTRWALVLPTAVSFLYIIILRTFFRSLPDELEDAAIVDGAGPATVLVRIALPLSKAALATLVLFYAVGHWQAFFNAILFITKQDLHPLQVYLRRVVIMNDPALIDSVDEWVRHVNTSAIYEQLKYALIIVSILPIICLYPFLQKYFVKGAMIGALKA
ncbi:MAG: carbohydrate ABC transporter permease [Spirochaetaceae bacterium]|nr:carbohydrate ABC transporter permease [Spirochaetaceae bacterium]